MDAVQSYLVWSSVALALIVLCSRILLPKLLAWRGVTMRRHTKFGVALVFDTADEDDTPVRMLNVGGAFQSASYISPELRHELVCVYHRVFADVLLTNGLADAADEANQARVLVLGGGGYSFPRWLATHTAAQIEAVEIDPAITALAREFFFLDEAQALARGRLLTPNADGWAYLLADEGHYRVIVNDAFSRTKPLGPMATDEGARHIHQHLTPDGIYLANVIAPLTGRKARVLRETLQTFSAEFAHVYLVPERPEEPSRPACNVLVASDRSLVMAGATCADLFDSVE